MQIQQLTEISEKLYASTQALTPADTTLMEILKMERISYGKIRTFNQEDSQEIILLTLKQNTLLLIKYLAEHQINIAEELLSLAYTLIDLKPSSFIPQTDLHAQMEKEKIIKTMKFLIVDIVYYTKFDTCSLINYLKTRRIPDDVSVNLAVVIKKELELESFELTSLSKKALGPIFLNLVKSYKHTLTLLAKRRIIQTVIPFINTKDKEIIYQIFYHLNQDNHKKLLISTKHENTPEYFGFVSSLIVDRECADIAYSKLEPDFELLETALKTLLSFTKFEEKSLLPKDQATIENLLMCINKISSFKCYDLLKFVSIFQNMLKIKIGSKIKGIIYDILSKYINENDLYVGKVVECREEIDKEIQSKDYFLLPRLIKFLNAYQMRQEKESQLIKSGQSMGSPYMANEPVKSLNDFRMFGFKSEDPDTLIECLNMFISPEIIKLNALHIRNAMIKDTGVIDKIIQFQIENSCVIDDVSIVNTIISHSSVRFFEYTRLFKDFSFYLNGDVLERISDDLDNGIRWIGDCYNKDFGIFILRNSGYFNELVKANEMIQKLIVTIYEKMLDENLSELEFFVYKPQENSENSLPEFKESPGCFYLFDSPDLLTDKFFKIFSKQLIYKKFFNLAASIDKYIIQRYASPAYECFIKAKAVCGLDVSSDIQFMKASLLASEELLGYLKIASLYTFDEEHPSNNLLLNFNVKDNSLFIKNFESENEFGKFLLFFSLQYVNKEIDAIIRNEIMRNLKNHNRIYLRMCILQLFKTKDLDHLLKILEKNFEDKELLFKLNIHNIVNGGKYFSKDLINSGDDAMKAKALFLLYYLNIWEKDYLLEVISKCDQESFEELKYLADDIKRL